jgi:hypothetical protein
MKKLLLLLFVSIAALSCSIDNDSDNVYFDILPVESYELPPVFEFGETYTISIFYKKPNDCYLESDLFFEKADSTRIIGIQSIVADRANCAPLEDEPVREIQFQFKVNSATPYLFKFFKGRNTDGSLFYEEVTIPIN